MLQQKLTSEPAENLKGAYVQKGSEWFLDELAEDHPVVATNKSLNQTNKDLKTTNETLAANLTVAEREREEAKAKSLPNGHRAVSIEIADLGGAAKAAGFTKDDIPTVKDKIATFEEKEAQAAKRADLTKAAEFAGVKHLDEFFSRKATDDLNIEWKTVDGKQQPYLVAEENGAKTETLFDEKYLRAAEGFKSGAATLFAEESNGKYYVGQESGNGGTPKPSVEQEKQAQRATGRYAL